MVTTKTAALIALIAAFYASSLQAVVIVTHGFHANHETWFKPGGDFFKALKTAAKAQGHSVISYSWNQKRALGLSQQEHELAGNQLAQIITMFCASYRYNPEFANNHEIIIVSHSMGGRVGKYCIAALERNSKLIKKNERWFNLISRLRGFIRSYLYYTAKPFISTFIMLATPHGENDPSLNPDIVGAVYNLYSPADIVVPLVGTYLLPHETHTCHPHAHDVELSHVTPLGHIDMHSPVIAPHLFEIARTMKPETKYTTYAVPAAQ